MEVRGVRLTAGLAAAWGAEVTSARALTALAERVAEPSHRARLLVLSAFCRAHASRLLARLTALGRGPLPVPGEAAKLSGDLRACLVEGAAQARASAGRYAQLALMARTQGDCSSAWVCELNRAEESDRAREMLLLAEAAAPVADVARTEPAQLG